MMRELTPAMMRKLTLVNPYIVPMTMGAMSTASQRVFQPIVTTAGKMLVPLCVLNVLNLQHDLDRPSPPAQIQMRDAFSNLPSEEAEERVVVDTDRIVTVERAASEWDRMTEPAEVSIDLPADLED